jgi:hypothetical protein
MNPNRRTFDYLHAELTMFCGAVIKRFDVWQELDNPQELTPELAADFLERDQVRLIKLVQRPHQDVAGDWRRMVGRVRNYNPETETPEEVMDRICGGLKR